MKEAKTKRVVIDEIDPSRWKYTDEEMSVFNIDRHQEDAAVKDYQLTGDAKLLEKLYYLREPTLRVWARKCSYIGDSEDDVFADLCMVWHRCIGSYKFEAEVRKERTKSGGFIMDEKGKAKTSLRRTNFNTFLFTSIRNHVSNSNKKRYSKKRLDNDGKPIDSSMRSLDIPIGEDESQSLYDVLQSDSQSASSKVEVENMIRIVSDGDQEVANVLRAFLDNKKVKKLSSACNLKELSIEITDKIRESLLCSSDKQGGKMVSALVARKLGHKKFKLLCYVVYRSRVACDISVKDTRLIRKVKTYIEAAKNKL